jgi:hypothetical protein
MPKQILDSDTIQGARNALAGLSGALAKQEAARWATHARVHVNRIYEVTKDVRPVRKRRADHGKRLADINHPMVKFAIEAILIRGRLDPDQAIEQTEMQPEFAGQRFPVSIGTLLRYLRKDYGLDRKQRRSSRVIKPHRRFEAEKPMDIYQFDISGLKKRWYYDVTTRRILKVSELEVSENHPNENPSRQQLWSFHLLDDHSRLYYLRFIPCLKPNATHVIKFLWEAFRELGIPKVLYTDNDPIIVCNKTRNAAAVLDRYFEQLGLGGFKLDQHLPGNPNATGKVEAGHKIMAKHWNLLGARFRAPTFDDIEKIAIQACGRHNWAVHSETGEMPMIRFRRSHEPMRMPPAAVLDSAFTADRLRLSITAAITISVNNIEYQLPRTEMVRGPGAMSEPPAVAGGHSDQSAMVPNPFLNRAGKRGDVHKIDVIWPFDADYFLAIADQTQFEIPRLIAVADAAGQYKVTAETVGQKTWKTVEASATERKRAFRAVKRDLDQDLRAGFIDETEHRRLVVQADLKIPLLDGPAIAVAAGSADVPSASVSSVSVQSAKSADSLSVFPRKKIETDPALLAAVSGGIVAPSMVDGRYIDYWTALGQLVEEGAITSSEFDKTWLKSIFNGREEINDRELREALLVRTASGSDRVIREGVA